MPTNPSETLSKYREKGYNILCPTTKIEALPEWHNVVFDLVKLSPDPKDKDVYPQDGKAGGPYILTSHALQKLSICAGVQWDPVHTKVTSVDRHYVAFSALGSLPKVFGQAPFFAEGDVDMLIEEDKIRAAWDMKLKSTHNSFKWLADMPADRRKNYVADKIRQEMNFKRQHRMPLAATTAKNRVIRALLGIKPSYAKSALDHEFVMPRIVFQPDMKDPVVKKALLDGMINNINGVYGPGQGSPVQIAQEPAFDIPPEDFQTVPDPEPEAEPDPEPEPEPKADKDIGPGPGKTTDFENDDQAGQIKTLRALASQKGFAVNVITGEDFKKGVPGIKLALEKFNDKNRLGLFRQLLSMPDDDIPF